MHSFWDHIQHVKWIILFFPYVKISLCITVSPPFGICLIFLHPPPLPSSCSFHLYTSSPSFPSLLPSHSLIPHFSSLLISHTWNFSLPQGLAFQMGLDDRVTSVVSPVYLPCPGMSSMQGTSGLTQSGAWNSLHRGCHPCTLDKEGSHCRGGSVRLNMNEAYSQGVFTPCR